MTEIKGARAEEIPTSVLSSFIRATEGDTTLPTCMCGNITGYSLLKTNTICKDCNTPVKRITDQYVVPITMHMLNNLKWLKPQICVVIAECLPSVNIDGELRRMGSLDYLVNGNKLVTPTARKKLDIVKSYIPNHQFGYSFFVNNLDAYLDAIGMVFQSNTVRNKLDTLKSLVHDESSYSESLNTPSKLLNESTDKVTKLITSYVIEALSIYRQLKINNTSSVKVDKLASKILFLIADYTYAEHRRVHTGNGSITRRALFSTPLDYTVRSTVLPILGPHKLTDMHHSYKPMVSVLRPFIFKQLLQTRSMVEAMRVYHHAVNNFNQEVYDVMVGLIENSREDGIPFLILRNPTQSYPSVFKVYVVKIGKDPDVDAMYLSTNGCVGPNWDHDGDQMPATLLADEYISNLVEPLKMYNNISNTSKPYWTSGVVGTTVGCEGIIDKFLSLGTPMK